MPKQSKTTLNEYIEKNIQPGTVLRIAAEKYVEHTQGATNKQIGLEVGTTACNVNRWRMQLIKQHNAKFESKLVKGIKSHKLISLG